MHDLLSLCNEFDFSGLHSQVTDFISAHSVAEDGARKAASDITEDKLQIRQALRPLQGALSCLTRDNGHLEQFLSLLRKDVVDLREAHAWKIATLEKGQTESSGRLANYEKEQEALKREIAGFREAQARSDREVEELRAQLAQEVRRLREEQARLEEKLTGLEVAHEALKRQLVEETGGLRGQHERFARELGYLRQQFTQLGSAQSPSEKKIADLGVQLAQTQREIENLRRLLGVKKFVFTSDLPNKPEEE
jgi:chromosome segregation ATPase